MSNEIDTNMILEIHDGNGYYYVVKGDGDGLNMIEIKYVDDNDAVDSGTLLRKNKMAQDISITMSHQVAVAMIAAIQKLMAHQNGQ